MMMGLWSPAAGRRSQRRRRIRLVAMIVQGEQGGEYASVCARHRWWGHISRRRRRRRHLSILAFVGPDWGGAPAKETPREWIHRMRTDDRGRARFAVREPTVFFPF